MAHQVAKSTRPLPWASTNSSNAVCRAADRCAVYTTSSAAFLASQMASLSMGPESSDSSRTGSAAHSTSDRSAAERYAVSRMSSTRMYSGDMNRRDVGR